MKKVLQFTGKAEVTFGSQKNLISLKPDEVLIEVSGFGLCGSDLSRYFGLRNVPEYPWTMGHEGFGRIIEVGQDISNDRLGQQTVIEPIIPCGECRQCLAKETSSCPNKIIIGVDTPGVASSHFAIKSDLAHPIPSSFTTELLGLVEPLAVAVNAFDKIQKLDLSNVLIIGGGNQGLLLSLLVRRAGGNVTILEISEQTRQFLSHFNLTSYHPENFEQQFETAFPVIAECSGSKHGWELGNRYLDFGGSLLLLGLNNEDFSFKSENLVLKQQRILTSYTYNHPRNFEEAISILDSNKELFGSIVTGIVEARDFQQYMAQSVQKPGKLIVRM